jgi:murein peptide amidase A
MIGAVVAMAAIGALWFANLDAETGTPPTGFAGSNPIATHSYGRAAVDRPAIAQLRRAVRPRRAVVRRAEVVIGRSSQGRAITATAANGLGNGPGLDPGPLVLVIGCIHGDECAGVKAVERSNEGCPAPGDGLVTVPNLNPDGRRLGTRINARGVDLNRNFPSGWHPEGSPGDAEYPGPRPLSEPESRLARDLIKALRPDVTIWFHQQEERLVRAWGPSVPAARTYARLAGEPFRRMPWLGGTAPNWQNHRFPGTSSFVVELPLVGRTHPGDHGFAIKRLADALER